MDYLLRRRKEAALSPEEVWDRDFDCLEGNFWEIIKFGLEMFIELPGDSNRLLSALSWQKSGRGLREAAVHR